MTSTRKHGNAMKCSNTPPFIDCQGCRTHKRKTKLIWQIEIITKFTFTYIYRFMSALISTDMYVTCTTGFTVSIFSFEN